MNPATALHGLRLVEYDGCAATAYAGRLLAGWGATVVLVRTPDGDRPSATYDRFFHAGKIITQVEAGQADPGAADGVIAPGPGCPGIRDGHPAIDTLRILLTATDLAIRIAARAAGLGSEHADDVESPVGLHVGTGLDTTTGVDLGVGGNLAERRPAVGAWPVGLVRVSDGWVAAGPGPLERETVRGLMEASWPTDADAGARRRTHDMTDDEVLAQWAMGHDRHSACREAQTWRLAFSPVHSAAEALAAAVADGAARPGDANAPAVPYPPYLLDGVQLRPPHPSTAAGNSPRSAR